MKLIFEQIRSGGDRNFGYLLADREAGTGGLIDSSYSPEAFVERAARRASGCADAPLLANDTRRGNQQNLARCLAPFECSRRSFVSRPGCG
jgi:hypothetical protein